MKRDTLGAMRSALVAMIVVAAGPGCTLFEAGATPCDTNDNCHGGLVCEKGFCARNDVGPAEGESGEGEGEGAEGEGAVSGEGEGAVAGEGEGATTGEGEGATAGEGEGASAGEGEGVGGGEGEGASAGEGEGEGVAPPTTVTLCNQQHAIPPWFDTHFQRRVPLAFCDTAAPDEAVAGLPATVILDSSNFAGFAQMLADGHDVIFVEESGTPHPLSYERQIFGGGTAVFNVLTESFNPHSGLDDIWMYFDDPGDDTDRSAPATVYAQYASVWHFEGTALLVDAKSGVNMANFLVGQNGNNVGSPPSATTGVVGGGIAIHGTGSANQFNAGADSFDFLQEFDGNGNPVAPPQVMNTAQGTISAMVNPNGFGHVVLLGRLTGSIGFDVSCPNGCGNNPGTSVNLSFHDQNDFGLYVTTNGGAVGQFTVLSAANATPTGSFHHVAGAWGGSSEILEADGASAGSASLQVTSNFNAANAVLGMGEANAVNNLNGVIDELRICTVPRDVAFLRAERQGYVKALFQVGPILTQ